MKWSNANESRPGDYPMKEINESSTEPRGEYWATEGLRVIEFMQCLANCLALTFPARVRQSEICWKPIAKLSGWEGDSAVIILKAAHRLCEIRMASICSVVAVLCLVAEGPLLPENENRLNTNTTGRSHVAIMPFRNLSWTIIKDNQYCECGPSRRYDS